MLSLIENVKFIIVFEMALYLILKKCSLVEKYTFIGVYIRII